MQLVFNFITGVMVGFEIIDSNDLENYDEDITFLVVDLFIIRLTFSW